MANQECVIAVFDSVGDAHEAVAQLEHGGWGDGEVTLISRRNEEELDDLGRATHDDAMEKTAAVGGAAGAALGLLAGSALFIIPGIGPVLFAGAMASGLTGGLVGGLVGAMAGWGVKQDHIRRYEKSLQQGQTLVVVTGDPSRLAEAKTELQAGPAQEVALHSETADADRIDE